MHAIKFQSLIVPSGLIANLFGPVLHALKFQLLIVPFWINSNSVWTSWFIFLRENLNLVTVFTRSILKNEKKKRKSIIEGNKVNEFAQMDVI